MKKLVGLVGIIIVLFVGLVFLSEALENKRLGIELGGEQVVHTTTEVDSISYQGKNGKDALTLLKEQAKVEQDTSGLVVSINGRKSDSSKREYWAFYVNGKLAEVGPADYKTKDEDTIEWKMEKY